MIGRCADVILKEYSPLNIFVYADMDTKLKRCIERAPRGENLIHTGLERKIREVDKERAKHWEFYTGGTFDCTNKRWIYGKVFGVCIRRVALCDFD